MPDRQRQGEYQIIMLADTRAERGVTGLADRRAEILQLTRESSGFRQRLRDLQISGMKEGLQAGDKLNLADVPVRSIVGIETLCIAAGDRDAGEMQASLGEHIA